MSTFLFVAIDATSVAISLRNVRLDIVGVAGKKSSAERRKSHSQIRMTSLMKLQLVPLCRRLPLLLRRTRHRIKRLKQPLSSLLSRI